MWIGSEKITTSGESIESRREEMKKGNRKERSEDMVVEDGEEMRMNCLD